MNFFGHTVISSGHRADSAFVFGSMLPDFVSMARSRPRRVDDPVVAAGVQHHLRTDDVFHAAPAFLAHCEGIRAELEARGVNWGAARAVGHVGTELILDGALLGQRPEARAHYDAAMREALHYATRGERAGAIVWRDGGERFDRLLSRLDDSPLPDAYREPAHVAAILERILRPRERLRLAESEVAAVTAVLEARAAAIADDAPGIVAHVEAGLAAMGEFTPELSSGRGG